ncbi:MAG: hypothetical protein M3O50_07485 [Myxococcota bacterium]|nr:hypothetical protein [Myxococcota bacterium]
MKTLAGVSREKLGWVFVATTVLSWLIILGMIAFVLAPILSDASRLGGHDWDQMEAHRYLVTKTIVRFRQFPFWNPYACGGHPNWGGIESGTTIVSPWFPFYMTMSLPHAIRVEVIGSALVSAVGCWLLAGRFTRSPALRALVVVAFAVNGRWALQIASGHTWHLAYGLTPWALYYYDRAVGAYAGCNRPRRRDPVLAGACLGLMVYLGGIYPLPQTIVLIALYGVFLASVLHSFRPITAGLTTGLVALGFSAPKLFPVIDTVMRYPRLVDSNETLDLTAFVQILTSHTQDMWSRPANVGPYGWHEFGMYVGWFVVIVIVGGCWVARGTREVPLKWAGLILIVLGFGSFDPHAPWPLLHHLPIFRSQHVPTRWQYPGLLLLITVSAATMERALRRSGMGRPFLEIVCVAVVAWAARDIGEVARQPVTHMFGNPGPTFAESTGPFHTETRLPPELNFAPDYAPPSLPAEMTNIGTIDCGTFPGLNVYVPHDQSGHVPGLGAKGRGDPAYKGEVFVGEGKGVATFASWSPNAMTVQVHGARPGEHVVINQNWDPGWSANGKPALDMADTIAAELKGPDETVVFRYWPRFLNLGLAVFLATLAGLAYAYFRARNVARWPASSHS